MSGNPFRRARTEPAVEDNNIAREGFRHHGLDGYSEPTEGLRKLGITSRGRKTDSDLTRCAPETPIPQTTKKKKRVVIKTPPRSPEEPQRRMSFGRTPSPPPSANAVSIILDDELDTGSTTAADSDLDQALTNARRNSGSDPIRNAPASAHASGTRAPYNPFARTLASTEASYSLQKAQGQGDGSQRDGQAGPGQRSARPVMDVDAFKEILLTGSASPSSSTNAVATVSAPRHDQPPPPGTSTLTYPSAAPRSSFSGLGSSSGYQHSPSASLEVESPTASSESAEEHDDESSSLMGPNRTEGEAPALPPKPRNSRGPQTVSFADIDDSTPSTFAGLQQSPGFDAHPGIPALERSPSDLNKPLPPPPASTRTEAAEETASASNETAPRKVAPPPPASRRQGAQPTPPTQTRTRSSSTLSKSSDSSSVVPTPSVSSDSTNASKPPPPPSRRSQTQAAATQDPSTPASASPAPTTTAPDRASMGPPPTPAPRRAPAKTPPTAGAQPRTGPGGSRPGMRSSPEASWTSTGRPEQPKPPPPPPARRAGGSNRSSVDGAAGSAKRLSGQGSRRVSADVQGDPTPARGQTDMLADLATLQREVDALRARSAVD